MEVMPCMGPDCDFAAKKGRETGGKMFAQLVADHSFMDLSREKWGNHRGLPGAEERWLDAKSRLVKAVEDLFVEDACNGF